MAKAKPSKKKCPVCRTDLNKFAYETACEEGLIKQVDIAQIKEVQRITFDKLAAMPFSEVLAILESRVAIEKRFL